MNAIITIGIIIGILILMSGSSGWSRDNETKRDLPWCGSGTRVILETKRTSAPFSTTGYQTHWRWVCNKNKFRPANFAHQIDDYLKKNGYFQKWPKSGSYIGSDNGSRQLINAPFVIEFASVKPLVVFLRPLMETDGKKYRADLLTSGFLTNYYYYGSRFLYHPDTLWFSPDLNQLPVLLNLSEKSEISIELGDSKLFLKETDGEVIISRQ